MSTNTNPVKAAGDSDPAVGAMRTTWTSGDFGRIAIGYEQGAADFIARLAFGPSHHVLDVACGTGNLTIPAARTGARVTGLDIAPNLIEQARARAAAEGLSIRVDEGNAEQLPYEDAQFDAAVSMFGAMFAAHPERVARELLRVTKSGGRVAMANWTPGGFVGEMLEATVRYLPPPGAQSPLMWGVEEQVRARFGAGASSVTCTPRFITLAYAMTPAEVVNEFRLWYGPTVGAFSKLDAANQANLQRDLELLWSEHNQAKDGTTRVEAEYLDVVAVVQ